MTTTKRLIDPPREVPPGLRWRLLATRDVTGSLWFFIPAAAAAIAAAFAAIPFARTSLLVIATMLLLLGLRMALRALAAAAARLRRMRNGFLTLGRMVTCRLAWDRKKAAAPYADFLADWVVNVGKSQMGKFMGCLGVIFVSLFIVPFALGLVMVAAILVLQNLHVPGVQVREGALPTAFGLQFLAGGIGVIALLLAYLLWYRRKMVDSVVGYMEWRRLAQPGDDAHYDADAKDAVELAKARGVRISLKDQLPEDDAGVELICQAEYSVRGERRMGEGRVRLSRRLDPAGIEPLLFDPDRPGKVHFLAGLPDEVRIDGTGRWEEVPGTGAAVQLALTGLAAAVTWVFLLPPLTRYIRACLY